MQVASNAARIIRCDRTILHFDFDCFYATVVERENPKLKSLPLAVQQKQIIVTCNYEARRRGLYKLQLVSEARRLCPEVIIVLGEDLTRFRNASKDLHKFLAAFSWNGRYERLGFDEAWMDCTDIINHNITALDPQNLKESFFRLDKQDQCAGFPYDASAILGHVFPVGVDSGRALTEVEGIDVDRLELRLRVASHLAGFLRGKLEYEKGFTATVGVSVNKLLAKITGSLQKPNCQTTLIPPYTTASPAKQSNVNILLDSLDLGKVPGIGSKISQKLREFVLRGSSAIPDSPGFDPSKRSVTVRDLRQHPGANLESLAALLSGPGWPKNIGRRVFELIHGKDDNEVGFVKRVPEQISIEDSYLRLDSIDKVHEELLKLSTSLLKRMRLDLVDTEQEGCTYSAEEIHGEKLNGESSDNNGNELQWIAVPRTLRLSTRPRPSRASDGSRTRSFNRISRSSPLPSFTLSSEPVDAISRRLVKETLIPMFRKLHPARSKWDLSLINVAITHMQAMAGDDQAAAGRDISRMFQMRKDTLATGKLQVREDWPRQPLELGNCSAEILEENGGAESIKFLTRLDKDNAETQDSSQWESEWDNEVDELKYGNICLLCFAAIPGFALEAHLRFHLAPG